MATSAQSCVQLQPADSLATHSNRVRCLVVAAGTGALAAVWAGFASLLVPHLLREAYTGKSFALLDRFFAGQPQSLAQWLGRWHVLSWSGMGAVLCAGAFLLTVTSVRSRWAVRLAPPLLAFLLVRCLLWMSFAAEAPVAKKVELLQHRQDGTRLEAATSFSVNAWSRWDSHVYLTIAQRGYEFFPCDIPWDGIPIARAGAWCGDTAWFPEYPALIWTLAQVRIPEETGGLLVSAVFGVLTLWLLWTRFLLPEAGARSALLLLLAALFPGAVYYHALYPVSITAFFMLLAIHLALQERWILCGLAGAAATLAYPQGAFLGPVLALWILWHFRQTAWWKKLGWIAILAIIMCSAIGLVLLVQQYQVGSWAAFPVMQSGYTGGIHSPLTTLWHSILTMQRARAAIVLGINTLFVCAWAVLVMAYWARRRSYSPAEACLFIFFVVFWLLPLALGDYSLTRRLSLLVPATPLARVLPDRLLYLILGACFLLTMLLGMTYFTGAMP